MHKSDKVVIVGGGYVGLELAEAFIHNGLQVTMLEQNFNIMGSLDEDIVSQIMAYIHNSFANKFTILTSANITEFIGEPHNIVGKRSVPESDFEIKQYLKKRCPFNQVTVMFKKSTVQSVGGYIDWYCDEDYYLWLRMYLSGAMFANTDKFLVNVRVGKEMYERRGGIKYFKSEAKLQKYMLKNNVIGFGTYFLNVSKRFIVQVLLPNKIRGWVFKKFAREK